MLQAGKNGPEGGWHYYVQGDLKNCVDKNIFKPALYAFLTATKADGLHIAQCPHIIDDLFDEDDNLLKFRDWSAEIYWGPLLNVHAVLLWLILRRGLVACPEVLRTEFRDAP